MEYEEMLIPKGFFRNHKSYIVNLKFVKSIVGREANEILMNTGEIIPLAVRRKDAFLKVLAV
jgi:two-component system LytT family response regulator